MAGKCSERCRIKNGPLRNSSVNSIFLQRFHIQNHPRPSITDKRRHKSKYLTWNSIRLKFAKKTSIPNYVQRLGYIKCYSSSTSWIQHPTFNVWLKIFSIWHNLLSCTCTNHCLNNLVNFKFNALSDLKYSLSRNIKAEHEASNDENRPFEAHC